MLVSGRLRAVEMAAIFAAAMPAMLKVIANHAPPFIARVDQNANVRVMYP